MSSPADHTFADEVLAAGDPVRAREMVCQYIVQQSKQQFANSNRWPPSVFIGWALPRFFHTTKSGGFDFLDAVIQGYVDAAHQIHPKFLTEFGGLFSRSMTIKGKELLSIYEAAPDRERLCDMVCQLPSPALRELTKNLVGYRERIDTANIFTTPGVALAAMLVQRDPTLADTISYQALFTDLKWLRVSDPAQVQAVDQLAKIVLPYQLNPDNGGKFSLHLASAPKQGLSDLAYAMTVLVNELQWGPPDFSLLGKRAVRYLEKGMTRARRLQPTPMIKMPPAENIEMALSAIRHAALSNIANNKGIAASRRPAM